MGTREVYGVPFTLTLTPSLIHLLCHAAHFGRLKLKLYTGLPHDRQTPATRRYLYACNSNITYDLQLQCPRILGIASLSSFDFMMRDTGSNKKLSYCWETVRRESMPRIAEIDVEMTT